MSLIMLFAGLGLLIGGAWVLVDNASLVARKWGVSEMVIGLTIVAFGTSMPELVVNIVASSGGDNRIALGNISGSNVFNIAFILGLSALVRPIYTKSRTTWIEVPLVILSAAVLLVAVLDGALDGSPADILSRTDALLFLLFFAIFLGYNVSTMKRDAAETPGEEEAPGTGGERNAPVALGLIILSLGLLYGGGKLVVGGATALALSLGVSTRIIALTIVAMGTSLPELITSIVAAARSRTDMALGNVLGSNIFNVFFILGLSGVIRPLPIPDSGVYLDLGVNLLFSLMIFLFIFTGGERKIERWEGGIFLAAYLAYLIAIIRG